MCCHSAEIDVDYSFHPNLPFQAETSVWSYGGGRNARGTLGPPLIKGRYGEPILTRIYNCLPDDVTKNGGFGRNEHQLHFHNAHNGAESDGAANVHHFPGTFYDYRWSTTLARRDKINKNATVKKASGPNGNGGLINVAGDYRELQGTMWAHDHRFFFTAENVYKGMLMMVNYYSGPDRGNDKISDGVNLKLPSGSLLDWGNIDFDVNLAIHDIATDVDGQCFFDIFTTDGFIGRSAMRQHAVCPLHGGIAQEVSLPHPQCLHVALHQAGAIVELDGGAVPVHCQRRQFCRQPDRSSGVGRAGQRRALRHRRRLFQVPHRRPCLSREPVAAA